MAARSGGVDPYGNTFFNEQEADVALGEIDSLLRLCTGEWEKAAVHDLAELLRACRATPGSHLWFVGD